MRSHRKLLPGQTREPTKVKRAECREHGIADALAGRGFHQDYDGWHSIAQECYEFGRLTALGAWGTFTRPGATT